MDGVIVMSPIGFWTAVLKPSGWFHGRRRFDIFWNHMIPYLDVWLVSELSNDWGMRAACTQRPLIGR